MTRSRPVTQAGRARTKHRAGAGAVPAPTSMKFRIFEDNSGAYHWAIVAASGDCLVRSASFASYEAAKQAAGVVRRGAGSASFEDRADDPAPLELAARGETATVRDDLDAERWLDEGGSFSSEAVTTWPARR
jgi:uncharacterized protein YegP (UPF0339 family)